MICLEYRAIYMECCDLGWGSCPSEFTHRTLHESCTVACVRIEDHRDTTKADAAIGLLNYCHQGLLTHRCARAQPMGGAKWTCVSTFCLICTLLENPRTPCKEVHFVSHMSSWGRHAPPCRLSHTNHRSTRRSMIMEMAYLLWASAPCLAGFLSIHSSTLRRASSHTRKPQTHIYKMSWNMLIAFARKLFQYWRILRQMNSEIRLG